MANLDQFKNQHYINVETYRRNGQGVKTPVWFVEYQDQLCFITEMESGKVKRMRSNPSVKVTPCKMDGTVTGNWLPANIRFMQGEEIKSVDKLMGKKYGVMKFLFELPKIFKNKPQRTAVAINLN